MYTTRDARVSPVFNNMMYPYKNWYNNDYQAQYISDTEDLDSTVMSTIEKHRSGGRSDKGDKHTKSGKRTKSRKAESILIYNYNDEGYPLDDLEDTYMEPLKYYGRGFNCKTMSPTKD